MTLTRADLPSHLGRWVTVTNPNPHLATAATWYGRLVALAEEPSVIVQSVGGGQGAFPQSFTITPADPPPPGTLNPRRQLAHDAVYAVIRGLGDELPPDPVHRNAVIWRAVDAAMDAAGVRVHANPEDTVSTPGDTVPPAGDTVEGAALQAGGHARTPVPDNGTGCDLTSGVPRPRPEDTAGDTGGDGVRFAYRATVRRGQVRAAITEAFELLDQELHPRRPTLDEETGRGA